MAKFQFNARISKKLAQRVRADARRSGKSLDSVVESILADFFGAWNRIEREKFYQHAEPKRAGRPVEVA